MLRWIWRLMTKPWSLGGREYVWVHTDDGDGFWWPVEKSELE